MARDNIRKSKDSQKCKDNTQNECLKYLKKNKNKLILGVICVIIMLIGIFLAIDKNNVYKKIPETIQNINSLNLLYFVHLRRYTLIYILGLYLKRSIMGKKNQF